MAERPPSTAPTPSLPSPAHCSGTIEEAKAKSSLTCHQNGSLDPEPGLGLGAGSGCLSSVSRSPASSMALKPVGTLGSHLSVSADPGSVSSQPQCQSLERTVVSTIRPSRTVCRSSQQEEPEALLDLILESQGQRLEDQRASLSLIPDAGEASICGACSPDQFLVPTLDFYYMLIQYQSHRIEDQRCSLPDLQELPSLGPEGQDDFFSLVQRVQSRRMDEQRASMLLRDCKDDQDPAGPTESRTL